MFYRTVNAGAWPDQVRWRAASAGLLGLAATLVIAMMGFGLGTRVHGGLGPASAAAGALLEALFTAGTILWNPRRSCR
jgi:hypothetical protein